MIGDREISAFRRSYYGLLSRGYLDAPDEAFLQLLQQGMDARIEAAERLSLTLAEGWRTVRTFCLYPDRDPANVRPSVADEYNLLFVSPRRPAILPYESWYMEKEPYGTSLAAVRAFLNRVGLEKRDNMLEPEDHIACELEIMGQLIARQEAAAGPSDEERWLSLQGEFLRTHLLPWVFLLCQDVEKHEGADFYRGVATLTRGFTELEQEALADWGPPAARREQLATRKERWGGPTFDLLQIEREASEKGRAEDSEQQGPVCS